MSISLPKSDLYKSLREKVENWARTDDGKESTWTDYVLLAPDLLHLLLRLMTDHNVPVKEKAKVGAAIAYFVSPVDIVPDVIVGPSNFLDDVALAAYVLKGVLNHTNKEVVEKHWAGDRDLLETIQSIVDKAEAMVGLSVWNRLRKLVD